MSQPILTKGGFQKVIIGNPITLDGELLTAEITPQFGLSFIYNLNLEDVIITTTNTGKVHWENAKAIISSGTDTTASSILETEKYISYQPGQGAEVIWSAIYTTGVSGSIQIAGCGDEVNGFFFGYNGTSFGILHRNNSVETWITQSNWNQNKFDGTSPYRSENLDTTKGNLYKIKYQWWGYGSIEFYIYDYVSSEYILVHVLRYANQNTVPHLTNPNLPVRVSVTKTSGSTDVSISLSSIGGYTEGHLSPSGIRHSVNSSKTLSASTEAAILTLQNPTTFSGETNKHLIKIDFMSVATDTTKNVDIFAYKDSNFAGTASYANVQDFTTPVQYDTALTSPHAVETGTAQTGAARTITLAAGASAVDDYYNGRIIAITGGTGIYQTMKILDYVGATKVASVNTWHVTPDNTSTYKIFNGKKIGSFSLSKDAKVFIDLETYNLILRPDEKITVSALSTGTGDVNVSISWYIL